ncbi:fungal-specific transcription factor domain-containing protein [Ustulina deusta]|nr:fungal-specific transcription factor domain-containing protein [Ustulina deusta]
MTEHLKSATRKRQRCRPAKSCENCRARKIKCDRGLPCRPCMRSRASLPCTYKSDHVPLSSGSQAQSSPRRDPILDDDTILPSTPEKSQSGDVPSLIEPSSISRANDSSTSSLSHRLSVLEQLCQQPGHDTRQANSLKDLEARLSRIEQHIGNPKSSEPRPSDKAELRIKLPHPHLRAEHEKTRLFGKTHWVHSLEQFNILSQMQSKPYSVVDGAQGIANGAMLEAAGARHRAKSHGAKLLQEPMPGLCESIPAKSTCDQAIDGYLRNFEPMFRILHVPSFMREYESYWTRAEPAQDGFLMKLTMVLTIGAIFLTDRSVATDVKRTARNWVYAVQWWLIGPTERDAMSIDGIQVFCLLLLARQTSALGGAASIMTEALSKLSFTLGLHIDPRAHASVTSFESELRRRLWLTVLELTTINSLNSTLPLLLHAGDYHVPLPSNVADSKLGRPADAEGRTKHEALDCSLQLVLAKSLRLRMQVVRELNDASRESAYEKAVALADGLQAHCRELTVFFQADDGAAAGPDDAGPVARGFHEKFLDTYFRRLILFLHRPFAHQARRDARYLPSRKACLDSSLIMASHTEAMALPAAALDDDFSYCCISGGGMFKGALGQDVILAVSLEVVTQLEEEEQDRLRDPRGADAAPVPRTDPLALLARSQRRPLVQFLRHVREQWKQVIRLGRPSLKQYLFVSCILSQIEAMEAGDDVKTAMLDTIRRVLRECTALLRESPAYGSADEVAWMNDTSPGAIDTMALFGFDFSALVGFSPSLPQPSPLLSCVCFAC